MDKTYGYQNSISGFTDYTNCFGEYDIVWTICGCLIFIGTILSYLPQNVSIIARRSNYGINPLMTFDTQLGQNLVFLNILALHSSDLAGLFQSKVGDSTHNIKVLSTFLTICNQGMDWYSYKFIFLLNFMFVDIETRTKRGPKKIKLDVILSRTLFGVSILIEFVMMSVYILVGVTKGFQSPNMRQFAKVVSILSAIANCVQYIPQMITTCTLRDRGSYSILSLGILIIGTTINFCFLFIGQGEDWSTILPVGVTVVQQIILFIICAYFMILRRRKKIQEEETKIKHDQEELDEIPNDSSNSFNSQSEKSSSDQKDEINEEGEVNSSTTSDTSSSQDINFSVV
ncbi:hypothetical protein TRFO_05507 [Tritrichomonas foetus]|uniref:PQ loop repeat family protein n=1 Tax=Tritrichomonas foetus TaxID=1144522 RepID=A0A1J4K7E0_9EUKA|nr:hypothetical protein TRFO_05507 [Tritrichomonas foetus]|eukprot:OHT06800.1 hypothetical protein TRFO_05507 [Tritrichomonas foetus]